MHIEQCEVYVCGYSTLKSDSYYYMADNLRPY